MNGLYASEINASDFMDLGWRLQVISSETRSKLKVGRSRRSARRSPGSRIRACTHYPDSEFARKYGGFA
jgi:hypothetical protein